jgi:GH15 family glucan-1,4-alpha-glucosidase
VKFYGFLSNSQTAALVGPDASVDWLAFPRFDGPSVFTRLLGTEEHGFYRIAAEGAVVVSQRYLPGTNVLETTFVQTGANPPQKAIVSDYLTVGRPELRRLVLTDVPVQVELKPRFAYGLIAPAVEPLEGGAAAFTNPHGREMLVFVPVGRPRDAGARVTGDPVQGRWLLPPGRYDLILRYVGDAAREAEELQQLLRAEATSAEAAVQAEAPHESLRHTLFYWKDRLAPLRYRGPFQAAVERALLVLYGLVYRTNGAIIAAPTASLPEIVGETRQWDYRFCWVRDGSYMAEALLEAGDVISARRFLEFLLNLVDLQGKPFQAPFFHIDGTLIRGERTLSWLPGFRNSRPVREGNAATSQTQLDIEGDFLWTVYKYVERTDDVVFLRFYWAVLETLVNWVADHWGDPDASLWEFRGQDAHYTHSKLMCWVALHYGAELADRVGAGRQAQAWRHAAAAVRDAIEAQGFNEARGHYVQAFGGETLDAALLTLPLYGYCPADAPRFTATLRAIERELVQGPWVYRYRGDMLGEAAHPFVLASSWLARVYLRRGERDRAAALVQDLLDHATDLGLLGEHFDVQTGEPRGNFPQGFSHLGVLMTALELARVESAEAAS